jgi:hypothetical protein
MCSPSSRLPTARRPSSELEPPASAFSRKIRHDHMPRPSARGDSAGRAKSATSGACRRAEVAVPSVIRGEASAGNTAGQAGAIEISACQSCPTRGTRCGSTCY